MFSEFTNTFNPHVSWESRLAYGFVLIIGPLAALYFKIHDSDARNLIIGAGFTAIPGFLAAAACNYFTMGRSFNAIKVYLVPLMAGAVFSIFVLGLFLPRAISEMRHLEDLRHLDPASIDRIEVYKGRSRVKVATVTGPIAIARFAQSASDATVGWPLRAPTRTQSWYLVVSGSSRREYLLEFVTEYPDGVIGKFIVDSGESTLDAGSFHSLAIREWIEEVDRRSNRW